MRKLVSVMVALVVDVAHFFGVYKRWSLYWQEREEQQAVIEGWPYFAPLVANFHSIDELIGWFVDRSHLWTGDTWHRLWDSTSIPRRLLAANAGRLTDEIDCDEYAVAIAEALRLRADDFGVGKILLLQVLWYDPADKWWPITRGSFGRLHGHHLCLYQIQERWWHASNWGQYGVYTTPHKAALAVVRSATGQMDVDHLLIRAYTADPTKLDFTPVVP